VAVQSALTGVATGLVAADEAVAGAMEEAAAQARGQVLTERETCEVDCEGMDWLARWDALMAPWSRAVDALRTLRATLVMAQGAVTAWIESGELPEDFRGFCDGIGTGVEGLLGVLEALHVEVPTEVTAVAGYTSQACRLAGPWIAGS